MLSSVSVCKDLVKFNKVVGSGVILPGLMAGGASKRRLGFALRVGEQRSELQRYSRMCPGRQDRRFDSIFGGLRNALVGRALGGTLLVCNRPPFVGARSLDALSVAAGCGEPMPLRNTPLFRREEQLDDCHLTWLGALPAFVSSRRFAFDLSTILSRATLQAIPALCACMY